MTRVLLASEDLKVKVIESLINDTNGKFFGATNIKKDGTVRKYGQLRTEVGKFVTGHGKSIDREKNPTLKTLWENKGKSEPTYKSFDLLSCIELVIQGNVYTFKGLPRDVLDKMKSVGVDITNFEELK